MQPRITWPVATRITPALESLPAPLSPSPAPAFMPQARASNTSNMLTPISRHPAAPAAGAAHAAASLFVVACCPNLIARP